VDFGNGPNDPGTNHDVLEDFLGLDPGPLNHNYEGTTDFSQPVDVFPREYFVVHYGKGNGGIGAGGSWEFFLVINGETSVTFHLLGNGPTNPDPLVTAASRQPEDSVDECLTTEQRPLSSVWG
jgi:hypothetical protein